MDRRSILTKTAKGLMEASGRTSHLSRDLRNLLKEVDGKLNVSQLQRKLDKFTEPKLLEALIKLEVDGFVREFAPQQDQGPMSDVLPPSPITEGDLDFTNISARPAPRANESAKQQSQADEIARTAAATRAREEAAAKARADAEAKARADAVARAKAEAEQKARQAAEARAKADADARARAQVEARTRAEAEARAKLEAEQRAKGAAELNRAMAEEREKAAAAAELSQAMAAERAEKETEKARQAAEAEKARAHSDKVRQAAEAEKARREAESERARKAGEAERARREAEEQARRESDEKARRQAEEKARQEAEERAGREAEEAARGQAQEQARRESEERARKEAGERAAQEAQQRAREAEQRALQEELERLERVQKETEERARHEALERARREEDERLSREAEEKARRDAEERERAERAAQLEAEAHARIEAERQARREAEEQARREEDERERRDAEERVRREGEERARREAEERARREAEERAIAQAKERARQEAEERSVREEIARRDAEEKARDEEKARREAEEQARHEAEQLERQVEQQAKQEQKARAKAEAEAAAKARKEARARDKADAEARKRAAAQERAREREAAAAAHPSPSRARRRRNWGKPVAVTLFLALVVAVAAVHFVPFDVHPYERAAQSWLGQPVKIGSVRLALVPAPRLRFENVTVGTNAQQMRIAAVTATPELDSLFGDRIGISAVALEAPVVPQAFLAPLMSSRARGGDSMGVQRITARAAKLDIAGAALPPLDLDVRLGADGAVQNVVLSNVERKLTIKLTPEGNKAVLEASADALTLPIGGDVTLNEFLGKGSIGPGELILSEFEGRAFNGRVQGNARLTWGEAWSLDGELSVRQLEAAQIAAPMLSSGRVEGRGVYGMKAASLDKLFPAARLEGNFTVQKGAITNVDMTRVLQGSGSGGGTTLFSEMNGSALVEAGRIQVRQLRLIAGLLNAAGTLDMDPQKNLSGRLQIELRAQTTQARANLTVSGTLKDPQYRRAN